MGLTWSTARNWTAADMPSQKGKLVVITGANSGIGFEAAKALATHGAHVILACRNESRGLHAEKTICQLLSDEVPVDQAGSVEFMQVDVGDFASVRQFASAYQERFEHLDVLINNAGVSVPPVTHTADGLEAHFAINHLGHFYLTSLLLGSLRKCTTQARVVNVSSLAHKLAWLFFSFATLGHTRGGFRDYCTSKMANVLFTYELQRRLMSSKIGNVVAVAAHPGACHSDIWSKYYRTHFPRLLQGLLIWLVSLLPFLTQKLGMLPIVYAATMPNVKGGEYYGPNGFLHIRGYPGLETSASMSYSLENGKKLWDVSEDTLGRKFDV